MARGTQQRPATPVASDFGRFLGQFQEISKLSQSPSCLALSKSRVTQFLRLNFKFITERKKKYVRKNAN